MSKSNSQLDGIKMVVDMTLWDVDEWEGKTTCEGVVTKWHNSSSKDTLMVKWDGYDRNQQAPLSELEKHNCKLLPGAGNILGKGRSG